MRRGQWVKGEDTDIVVGAQTRALLDQGGGLLVIRDRRLIVLGRSLIQEDALHGKGRVAAGRWPPGVLIDVRLDL